MTFRFELWRAEDEREQDVSTGMVYDAASRDSVWSERRDRMAHGGGWTLSKASESYGASESMAGIGDSRI